MADATVSTIHPAWWSRAGTWLLNIGKHVKNAVIKVAQDAPLVDAELRKIAPTVEGISELFVKGSGTFEQHLLDVWGAAASAVHVAGDAAAGNGLSVQLDADLVAAIKGFVPTVQQFMHPAAGPAAPVK